MAKLGEGDERWIVEERVDGTNVHNWHWAEKDSLEWSKQRLTELLSNLKVVKGKGSCWINTTNSVSVEGEAYVNIRKGKIIPGYELHVRVNWEGELRDISGEKVLTRSKGVVEFPYIADENAGEDPEIKFLLTETGPGSDRLKDALRAEGKKLFLKKIQQFVDELAKGGPASQAPSSKPSGSQKSVPIAEEKKKAAIKVAPKEKKGFRTVKITQRFLCRKEDLYDVLLSERRWMAFTQAKASITAREGSSFTLFDGSISGEIKKLESPTLIVQKWRFNSWEDGVYSTVNIKLEEPEVGVTLLKLVQENVPEEDRFGNGTVYEVTERGWNDLIFNKIKAVFGYGV